MRVADCAEILALGFQKHYNSIAEGADCDSTQDDGSENAGKPRGRVVTWMDRLRMYVLVTNLAWAAPVFTGPLACNWKVAEFARAFTCKLSSGLLSKEEVSF